MAIKEPINDKQHTFFNALFESGNKESAREAAGYSRMQMNRLCDKYREYILLHTSGSLAVEALNASKVLAEALTYDGVKVPVAVLQMRVSAAKDILDRQGMGKANLIDLGGATAMQPIFLIPAKDGVDGE